MRVGRRTLLVGIALMLATAMPSHAEMVPEVELERLTSPEVAARLAQGWTTIIIPTGGTEQNGAHLAVGKHNVVVAYAAKAIAQDFGKTLVAPVMAYVPEGRIEPPEGHMLSPGTISLPEPVFAQVLEAAARSFIATGFKTVLFIGDSGGNQAAQGEVAARLTDAFAGTGAQVFAIDDYYAANGQVAWLISEGESDASIGTHAGIRETSELLEINPGEVRQNQLAAGADGVHGRPERASAARGQKLLALKIEAALRQIRRLLGP